NFYVDTSPEGAAGGRVVHCRSKSGADVLDKSISRQCERALAANGVDVELIVGPGTGIDFERAGRNRIRIERTDMNGVVISGRVGRCGAVVQGRADVDGIIAAEREHGERVRGIVSGKDDLRGA